MFQNVTKKENTETTFYFGPTMGKVTNTNNSESLYNAGIPVEMQKKHHLFNVFFQSLIEFRFGSDPVSNEEYSLTYMRIISLKKIFIGIGS